jgi:hypothetical protein
MVQCPYPETITDKSTCRTESNLLYVAWHKGYEAHKFELANQSILLASLAVALDEEIRNVVELKMKLKKQKAESQETNQ